MVRLARIDDVQGDVEEQVESPSNARDDSEIEGREEHTKEWSFKMFGLKTKSSLRLDCRTMAGLYTSENNGKV